MAFWQENYAFIKDVYDSRSQKMVELMNNTDKAITEGVLADKIYTSNEFAKVKDHFTGLAKNLEQSEVKDWLASTKETLMGDKDQKTKGEEGAKLEELLDRYDKLLPKVADTKLAVDSLWKAYQFTDEMAPHQEWLVEKKVLATRDINSNSAGETEELIERQEKVLDQLDKKRKVITDLITRGTKLKDDPKAPVFLNREVNGMKNIWDETNHLALDRLNRLRDNQAAWERYENKRNDLSDKLNGADRELADIKKIYDLAAGPEDVKNRTKTAATIRKDIESVYKTVFDANEIVQTLLTDDMKMELNEQVEGLKARMETNGQIDEKIKNMEEFNVKFVKYTNVLKEAEEWLAEGRKRMDVLLNPPDSLDAEERVMNTMELGEDIRKQIELHEGQQTQWNEELCPTQDGEDTPDCQAIVSRMDGVSGTLDGLNTEAETEAAKFGEDVKYLADFTNSTKKFDPWIKKSEAKVKAGIGKPEDLESALELLEECKTFQVEAGSMKKIIDDGIAAAQKMSRHDEADRQYADNLKRWEAVNKMAAEWIKRMETLVEMWKKQAETAEKVSAAISAPADSEMKIEDLEAHLNSLKQMFIEKQKMMDQMNTVAV